MKRYRVFALLIIGFQVFLASCSLKYAQEQKVDEIIPEFTFSDTKLTRYEGNKKTLELNVDKLEQFKDGSSMYAKDVVFSLFEDNKLTTEGSCVYLGADTKKEIYELFDSIRISNKKENFSVTGRSFHWDGKSEQLVAGRNDTVTVEKDGMVVRGSGFSASGASSSYRFTSVVTGNIESEK
ncbi:MAG: LPS export ABC transporter periplasmic protein LptC [Treponema sp.]|nr:LPS export ABC transporter periplasmic protein LptC [Treponema sp.]